MQSDYSYEYEHDDFYCYPGTNILKNKFGVKDKNLFFKIEREVTSLRTTQAFIEGIEGNFDAEHLCSIHRFLFQDIYEWAGTFRKVNISKGYYFCQSCYIKNELEKVFLQLKNDQFLKNITDIDDMSVKLSYYLSEINAVHPFREGNGRTQRLFINFLAEKNNYVLNFANVAPFEMIDASSESFSGNYEPMNNLIRKCLSK